ncbi:MAG: tRNA cyclic N6-threonylcarbamoyladenosine(37) synthase TcdA [Chromatiales bacterium]|nr:tRNA cyclic N6-threonylcarbamoyladenosine(37) synthase TcdA [Gammaproteobacteria bacterium]MBW6476749.1 tRNA cyclic N6-threonylcarbamoyladenosine(37) synthase TcdA [Chromatiales bacterium]
MSELDYQERFDGIRRLYGDTGATVIRACHVCVIGIGGVGSWAVEALARSGVGAISLIDHDDIAPSNTNRQLHTLSNTLGQQKTAVMAERVRGINPDCVLQVFDTRIDEGNQVALLGQGYDYVIDAIDQVRPKAALLYYCKRNKIPVITTGGAGGMIDPTRIRISDLSRTEHDPLAAKLRQTLRRDYGFSRNPQRRFGIDCVYSDEQPRFPASDGGVCRGKPAASGVKLDCASGYGSASFVTAGFGFAAVSRVLQKIVDKRQ